MALLSAYMMNESGKSLGDWLSSDVFANMKVSDLAPEENGVNEFEEYIKNYKNGLSVQKKSGEVKLC